MKNLFFTLYLCFLLTSCNNAKRSTTKLTQFIPENSNVILSINDVESFKSDIKNNAFINKLASSSFYKDLSAPLDKLSNFNTNNKVLICFGTSENESSYTIITKYSDSLFNNQSIDTINWYHKTIDSIYIGSPSQALINSISKNTSSLFESFEQSINTNASFSIFLNTESSNKLGNSLFKEAGNAFTSWIMMDTQITPDQISFNGISTTKDTLPQLIRVFKNTIPQENNISQITPVENEGFLSFTYDNFETIHENIKAYNGQAIDSTANNELFETANEIGEIYFNNENVVVLKSLDAFATKEALRNHQNLTSSYRNVEIYEFNSPSFFKDCFKPLIFEGNISKYFNINNFFVFARSEAVLQNIITNYQNGTTLANDDAYNNSVLELSDESSLLISANPLRLKQILSIIFNENLGNINLKEYKSSALQFVQDDGFVHVNTIIKKSKSRAQQNTISEEFNVTLDADLLTNPQFVINHRTKQKDIVVQDIRNNLYLISNGGKILWKKQLTGPVLGQIQQVDLYKNRRLQLAFATPNRVYIIDRNGRDVSPFPLLFNDAITQPLSVFDYDNNKNYRFIVTQGNALLMYDNKGKSVSGFRYSKTSNSIISKPKHFRINSKDYIVFAAGNSMMILNRQGRSRINVKENISFSNNSIYKYKNKFTTTTIGGELVQVNSKGVVSKQSLSLPSNHALETTDKTLVTLSDNKLSIKQKTIELDFGNYTTPKIFYLNDKIYVTLTDLQTQKVYLFDSQARPINNFPVYGNSVIDLANIDNDNNLEFVTKGESNSIIVYQKN